LLQAELVLYRVLKKLIDIFVITIQHGNPRLDVVGDVVAVIKIAEELQSA